MSLEQLNLNQSDISEIKIEEVQKLLSQIGGNSYLTNFDLDGNRGELSNAEQAILEKLQEIENKRDFIEALIGELEKSKIEVYIIELNKTNEARKNSNPNNKALFANKAGQLARIINLDTSHANIIFDNETLSLTNQYQIDLLIKIFGVDYESKGYNKKYLNGFSDKIGEYIISIEEFEKSFENGMKIDGEKSDPNVVNSRALANYFKYLIDNKNGNIYDVFSHIKNIIGTENLKELSLIWRSKDKSIAQGILNQNEDGKTLIETIKNPQKIFEKKPEIQKITMEIADENVEKILFNFIKENKNNPDFKTKFIEFYSNVKDSCSNEARIFLDKIINEVDNGNVTQESITQANIEVIKQNKQNATDLEEYLEKELGIGNSSSILKEDSIKIGNSSNFLNNQNNIISPTFLAQKNLNYSPIPKINLKEHVDKMNGEQITKLLKFIDGIDGNSCGSEIFTNNLHIEKIKLDELYKTLSEKLIKLNNDKIKNKLLEIIEKKSLSKEKNQEIIDKIFNNLTGIDCNTKILEQLNTILKEYGIEIDITNKNSLTELIDLHINNSEIGLRLGTFGEVISEETQEKFEELKIRRENNEVLKKADENEFLNLMENLENGVDAKVAMKELKNKVKEREEKNQREKIENNKQNDVINNNKSILSFNDNSGLIIFKNTLGIETKLELNQKEKEIVNSNPEILNNIVNFYNILDKIGLSKLWGMKESIFNSISNVEGIGFNIDGDYLSENEVKIFLNSILKSVGENTVNKILTIDNFIAQIEIKNNTQFSGSEAQVNMYGDTSIEEKFINKFNPRGSLMFNNTLFENSL